MLSRELFVAVLLIGLLATILGGVLTATSLGADEESDLQILMSPVENLIQFKVVWVGGAFPLLIPTLPWLGALWNTLTFQSPLFENTAGQYVQWTLWLGFGVVIVIGLGMWLITVIRGGGG